MEGDNDMNSSLSNIRALVVDDNAIVRKIHEMLLKSIGVKKLDVLGNGKEVVDIHSSGQTFDLILMDLDMPIMNGIEATKTLRSMGIACKIAGLSTCSVEAEIKEFMEAGLDLYLEKPLTTAKLDSILKYTNTK